MSSYTSAALPITVVAAPSQVALTTSKASIAFGQSVTFTASVASITGGPVATGNVDFKEGTTVLGTSAPPNHDAALGLGFIFGAGGGESAVFRQPRFQRRLPGKFRQQPDISYLADPFTGVEIIQTVAPGQTVVEVIGGTSLACPMFSALWAIAAQAAGDKNIGQAAQTVYELHDGAIDDIRPSRVGNVTGIIHIPGHTFFESAADLSAPLFDQKRFLSALRQGSSTSWFNLTFGTDSSLTVDEGWDNVTGLGTPNAPVFVREVLKELRH